MSELSECLHCGESLKKNAFGIGNEAAATSVVTAWNAIHDEAREGGCKKCLNASLSSLTGQLGDKIKALQAEIVMETPKIPVLSLHQPFGWRYRSIGLVTAQTTTGTGLISELTTGWTDFFGRQSKVYNNKIRAGEDLCKGSIRLQAALLGGNAVIGVDIDYAEVGGQRAMLMVCMTGTAVQIENDVDVLPGLETAVTDIRSISAEIERLAPIKQAISIF